MKTIDIRIKLDPVNDGALIKEYEEKGKDEGALIIATNGDMRIAGLYEAKEILDRLSEVGQGEFMGRTPYVAMFNGEKILKIGSGRCFAGSVMIMKYDKDGTLSMLSGDEFGEAATEFASRLITLVGGGIEFSAFEIS